MLRFIYVRHLRQALFLDGPQMHMALEQLTHQLTAVDGESIFQLRVGDSRRLAGAQPGLNAYDLTPENYLISR